MCTQYVAAGASRRLPARCQYLTTINLSLIREGLTACRCECARSNICVGLNVPMRASHTHCAHHHTIMQTSCMHNHLPCPCHTQQAIGSWCANRWIPSSVPLPRFARTGTVAATGQATTTTRLWLEHWAPPSTMALRAPSRVPAPLMISVAQRK